MRMQANENDLWDAPAMDTMKCLVVNSGRAITSVEEWLTYAPPKSANQVRAGRSAMESARAWFRTGRSALPDEIKVLLDTKAATKEFEPLIVIPEYVTRLDKFR